MDAKKVLNDPKATKAELRAALAYALGVTYQPPTKEETANLFNQCKYLWLFQYRDDTGLDYSFSAMDAGALKGIISKMEKKTGGSPEQVVNALGVMFSLLPKWYKENAYSLAVVNKKFNEIVASIKMSHGKQPTTNYKEQLLAKLHT